MDDRTPEERLERLAEDVHVLFARHVRQSDNRKDALDEVMSLAFYLARSYGPGKDREALLREVPTPGRG